MLAMCALALCWNWDVWAATTLLCFFGSCRIGEVLKAERGDFLSLMICCVTTIVFTSVSGSQKVEAGVQKSNMSPLTSKEAYAISS